MEFMQGAFNVGSFWFWTLILVYSAIIVVDFVNRAGGLTTFVTLVVLNILNTWGDVPVWATIIHDPLLALSILVGYIGCGVMWTFAKWWFFIRAFKRDVISWRQACIDLYGTDGWKVKIITNPHAICSKEYMGTSLFRVKDNKVLVNMPQAADYKCDIYMWLAFWPWSCILTILQDPVKRLFLHTYQWVSGLLDRMTKYVFSDMGDL